MPWSRWVDPESRLTGAQRYFYLIAGLQWFNELLTFAFTIMVLITAVLVITDHSSFLRPSAEAFVVLPIALIGTNLIRALWGLRHALSLSWKRAVYALTLWFSLTWAVSLACMQGLFRRGSVFLRTPKALYGVPWAAAVQAATWEAMLGLACVAAGVTAVLHYASTLTLGLMILCFTQAFIFLSAPLHSVLSLQNRSAWRQAQSDRAEIFGNVANEARLGIQVTLLSMTLIIFVVAASLLPSSSREPWWYSIFNPSPLLMPQAQVQVDIHPVHHEHPHKPDKSPGKGKP